VLTRARDDVTKRRIHFAIVTLSAFVREVTALRGKAIDAADADDWIADAQAIIGMLKAQRLR
jgi:hypothetical protein